MLPGFTYTYVVEAVNASGTSERTAKATILIPTPGKPNAVRNFEHGTIRRGNGATTNIRLSWDAPQGFTTNRFGGTAGYVIERALDLAEHTERGLDWENLATVSIGTHTYTDNAAVDAANADRIMPFGTTWRYRIRAVSGLDTTKQSDNSYVDAAIPMPSGVPSLITDEKINYGGSFATGYKTLGVDEKSFTCAVVRWDVHGGGSTDHRILRLGPGVTSWHDPDAVLVSSTTGLMFRSTTADITRVSGSGGSAGGSVCDTTVEAGETYIYIVQGRNSNGWNTQVVDEFNVIATIAVIYIETGSDAPPPPTEVEVEVRVGVEVYSATMTVGSSSFNALLFGWDKDAGFLGITGDALTDADFVYENETYEFLAIIFDTDGTLTISFDATNSGSISDAAVRSVMALYVDGTAFALGDATYSLTSAGVHLLVLDNSGLSWSAGDTVQLEMRVTE